ncbi:sugar ABC transporter permease [Hydrogenoanaerobacterium sp.]|uniref:carbohydrate ABC transporter permease n=1 Tax=Hydrogenoanaerobacterium sp. TaxID=2953763 RepID=UPI00289DE5E5|nr:sugar ABC transporter permease [Hydrogenoanaerobacterium sp.]
MHKNLHKYFPIFVLPTLIAFSIAFLVPFLMGLALSFCDFTIVSDATFVGFNNYVRAFTDPSSNFLYSLGFTACFTMISIITINVIAFSLALLLTKGLKGTNVFRSIFFTPNLIGGIVLGYVWQTIIDAVLSHYEVTLLFNPKFGFWGLVLVMNWQLIGYMMIIYIAGIQNIPGDIREAAAIDGANGFQTLFRITIPMIMSSITICVFLTLTNSFKLFDLNLALTGGGPANKTEMLALNIYRTFYNRNGWSGAGQAKAVVFFLLVGVIALAQLKITRSREVENQ